MSNHHQDKNTSTRPRQEGRLALLPSEVILNILSVTEMTEKMPPQSPVNPWPPLDPYILSRRPPKVPEPITEYTTILSALDMRNLALTSSSLFYPVRSSFYRADSCHAFRSALKHADIDAIKRCAEFGAAPDLHWHLEDVCYCKGNHRHLFHRPIDVFLLSVKHGSVPISKAIEVLQWLLDNGYDAYEQSTQVKDFPDWSMEPRLGEEKKAEENALLATARTMPEILLHTLAEDTGDRDRIEGICQMIYMLLDHGYLIPYNVNVFQNYRSLPPGAIHTPMNAAIMCQCPPHFLRALLELYKRHGVDCQLEANDCPESMNSWVGWSLMDSRNSNLLAQKWMHRPVLDTLAWNLYTALLDPAEPWKEAYNGELADIFEEKIELMEKYNFIDNKETNALRGMLEALQCIATMAEELGGLDRARDGKKCWQLICDPLRVVFKDLGTQYFYPRRVHRFEFNDNWHPWVQFYEEEDLQQMYLSKEYRYPWIREGDLTINKDGKVVDRHFRTMDSGLCWNHRKGRLSWMKYDYDGFLERLSQEWDQSRER
ncbi:hypothetical protein FPOAC2_01927 [Fusarium poae]|uniref:Uncharacterized protein n=1 Tax=Fusarium poae TaxID=36050 RepID=A0A1B8B522_FUSPO|nr:hypothetical protein FPOAC1_001840 [Fusarium poae]KAG8675845.1 hypothetical protein FPOAC1_001840 [Fusarium poae]OBS27817.1 hypothetical protein FPOA_01760 [Fusarium poae]